MIRRVLFPAVLGASLTTLAQADTARDAATCAAFNWANWDYEVGLLSNADRDPTWKEQAKGFETVAQLQGMSASETRAFVSKNRAPMLAIINSFMASDPAATTRFDAIGETCSKLINTQPELSAFR